MTNLWQWAISAGFTVAGILSIALGFWFGWTGVYLLIAPLLIAAGVTSGAIFAGLRSPGWAVLLFGSVIVAFVVLRYLNPLGVGGAL